ncbi:MAG: D-Ala-D-Ala carboxypeptidase family metallohydrolase [Candidatus Hatepunaea meridiana]|nr:D-Ala-D-Ala carboxypeptidase family metallohydrolase [Candidatus Hatepunaea meridiana]
MTGVFAPDPIDDYLVNGASLEAYVMLNDNNVGSDTIAVDSLPPPEIRVYFANSGYEEVPKGAFFYVHWDSIWVVVDSLTDAQVPTVTLEFSANGKIFGAGDIAWDSDSSYWKTGVSIDADAIPTLEEWYMYPCDILRAHANYSDTHTTDEIRCFDLVVNTGSLRNYNGSPPVVMALRRDDDADVNDSGFVANRVLYDWNDNYFGDNLFLELQSFNVNPDTLKAWFESAQFTQYLLDPFNNNHGSAAFFSLDDFSGEPYNYLSDLFQSYTVWISQGWPTIDTPSTSTGRAHRLRYKVTITVNNWRTDWWPSQNSFIVSSPMIYQNPVDILRQEYFDLYGKIRRIVGDDTIFYVDPEWISPLLSNNFIDYDVPLGMHPSGIHHHYSNHDSTQNLAPADSIFEIWCDSSITVLIDWIGCYDFSDIDPNLVINRTFTSGYRCPIKNSNLGGAGGSAHMFGSAIDYNLYWNEFRHTNEDHRKKLSKIFYKVYSSANLQPANHNYTGLYGQNVNNWGTEIIFKRSYFLNDTLGRVDGYPDPGKALEWPLRYISGNDTIIVCYTRAHTDIRHRR